MNRIDEILGGVNLSEFFERMGLDNGSSKYLKSEHESREEIDVEAPIKICLADKTVETLTPGENMNTLIVGTPGCGKTFSNIIPTILSNLNGSIVVDDKKGNLYDRLGPYLKEKGYQIELFDLINFEGTFKYNMFAGKTTKEEFMTLAEIMLPMDSNVRDRFFTDAARELMVSVIGMGKAAFGENFSLRNLIFISSLISSEVDIETKEMQTFILDIKESNKYYSYVEEYKGIKSSAPKTWRSIFVTFNTAVYRFSSPRLFDITSGTKNDFTEFGTRKKALFVVNSDVDEAFAPIIQLMYRDVVGQLIEYADVECDETDNRLPVHVSLILDDFASGVRQENIENVIANCRSRNISYLMAIQSVSQLKAIYDEYAQTIMDCMNFMIFYSTTNIETAYLMSKMSSKPVDEIFNMKEDDVLIVKRCKKPYIAKRFKTLEMPEFIEVESMR